MRELASPRCGPKQEIESPVEVGGTVYLKLQNGGSAVTLPVNVKKAEYVQIVENLLDVAYSRPFWIPNTSRLEKILVLMFVRGGKRMTHPIRVFVYRGDSITQYRFKGTDVFVQRFARKSFASITFSKKTDRWMRLSVVYELLAEFRPLQHFLQGLRDDELHMLSEMWKVFVERKRNDPFRIWMKRHSMYEQFHRRMLLKRNRF